MITVQLSLTGNSTSTWTSINFSWLSGKINLFPKTLTPESWGFLFMLQNTSAAFNGKIECDVTAKR